MSDENPYPYGENNGDGGCQGCRNLDELFGMEVYPLCLEKGEEHTCELSGHKPDCWESELPEE